MWMVRSTASACGLRAHSPIRWFVRHLRLSPLSSLPVTLGFASCGSTPGKTSARAHIQSAGVPLAGGGTSCFGVTETGFLCTIWMRSFASFGNRSLGSRQLAANGARCPLNVRTGSPDVEAFALFLRESLTGEQPTAEGRSNSSFPGTRLNGGLACSELCHLSSNGAFGAPGAGANSGFWAATHRRRSPAGTRIAVSNLIDGFTKGQSPECALPCDLDADFASFVSFMKTPGLSPESSSLAWIASFRSA